ncbi:MAG: TetR/AcrR family transcriptional regulator [Pseudomonadota bacterium]
MSSARQRPKDPAGNRAAILQGALEEFALRGYDGATTRAIAARTGLTHGMIRYHFKTKEGLWLAAVAHLFARLNRAVVLSADELQRLEGGDLDILRDWLKRYVRYCAEHPEHARIMMQESVAPTPRLRRAIRQHVAPAHRQLKALIESLQARRVLPADAPPESIIYMITGACQNLFALAPEPKISLGYDALSDAAVDAHAEAVVALFVPEVPRPRG